MRRIEAAINKMIEKSKVKIRLGKVETALTSAELNAKEEKSDGELKLQSIMEKFADSDEIKTLITEMSTIMDSIENAERTLERIEKIKKYINEEVEVEKE